MGFLLPNYQKFTVILSISNKKPSLIFLPIGTIDILYREIGRELTIQFILGNSFEIQIHFEFEKRVQDYMEIISTCTLIKCCCALNLRLSWI